MKRNFFLGIFITVITVIIYLIIFIPLSILFRFFKIDILDLKFSNKKSYWIKNKK